jgi:transposase InsO family protein
MTRFIDAHRRRFGVAAICHVLGWNASTYYAYKARPPSDRALADAWLEDHIERVWDQNYQVYGAYKVWRQLAREGIQVARCTVARLMARNGLAGVRRGRTRKKTTTGDQRAAALPDLVERCFDADRPDRIWVADLTYARTPTRQTRHRRRRTGRPPRGGRHRDDHPQGRRRRGGGHPGGQGRPQLGRQGPKPGDDLA